MTHTALDRIAERQKAHAWRDVLFGGFVALLLAFVVTAIGTHSSNLAVRADAPATTPPTVQELIDSSVAACGDRDHGTRLAEDLSRPDGPAC